jgi:hypothetical protein
MISFPQALSAACLILVALGCQGRNEDEPPDTPPPPPVAHDTGKPTRTVRAFLEDARRGRAGYIEGAAHFTKMSRRSWKTLLANKARGGEAEEWVKDYEILEETFDSATATVRAIVTTVTAARGATPKTEELVFVLKPEGVSWRIFRMGKGGLLLDFEDFQASMAEYVKKAFEEMERKKGK